MLDPIMVFLVLLVSYGAYKYYQMTKELKRTKQANEFSLSSTEEIKNTLRIGLYHRFKKTTKKTIKDSDGTYEVTIEDANPETPIDFEKFVAKIIAEARTSQTFVTQASGDQGVDIEEELNGKKYLWQVKCFDFTNKVAFDPIAIIHSQVILQKADGGFVITTSDFSDQAKEYASKTNIHIINGKELVDLWFASLSKNEDEGTIKNPVTTLSPI